MRLRFASGRISFSKELNELDKLAIDFSKVLRRHRVRHVFVAGYVAILFGRPRVSDDIDVLMEPLNRQRFLGLWKGLLRTFECQTTARASSAFDLSEGLALRFSRRNQVIPNVEVKLATTPAHKWALKEALEVAVSRRRIDISPIELQVAYKLFLGSDKDLEDARHLFQLFRDRIQEEELRRALRELKVPPAIAWEALGWR